MSVKLNNSTISVGFQGLVRLGKTSKLYTATTDDDVYNLYGTLFKKQSVAAVTPPSGSVVFYASDSIDNGLSRYLSTRESLVKELSSLNRLRDETLAGKYDYGVSDKLVDILTHLSENTIKQLPSAIVGGNLSHDDINKASVEGAPSKDVWSRWSHVSQGPRRYSSTTDDDLIVITSNVFSGTPACTDQSTTQYYPET